MATMPPVLEVRLVTCLLGNLFDALLWIAWSVWQHNVWSLPESIAQTPYDPGIMRTYGRLEHIAGLGSRTS